MRNTEVLQENGAYTKRQPGRFKTRSAPSTAVFVTLHRRCVTGCDLLGPRIFTTRLIRDGLCAIVTTCDVYFEHVGRKSH